MENSLLLEWWFSMVPKPQRPKKKWVITPLSASEEEVGFYMMTFFADKGKKLKQSTKVKPKLIFYVKAE